MLSVEPRIDHRITSGRKGADPLGIFANTVDRPSAPKPKKKTAKADADEAVMQNRKARYQLQRAAQGLLPQERVAHCQRSTMSVSGVAVYRSANGASYGNLTTCGSVWHCPICAAKITEGRRQELQGAINAWAASGGTVYLMSLTFPHQINQPLKNNLDLFSGALTKFKQSKLYRNVMAAVGSAGSIRSMEVTHGVHGWHPHTHDLVFAKPGQLELLQTLQMAWIETLIKVGIADRSQINDMLKAAFDVQNGDYAAEYVAKFGHEATEASKTITENHWGASSEMTKSYAKVGKRLGGRTPEQCAAYLRVSVNTIFRWEDDKAKVPFVCFELLRVVSETVRFKMSHPSWDGWFINYHGVLHSPDIGGKGFTPEQLILATMTRSEAALLRNDVKKLQSQLDAAIAENTALREMFLDNGVTDEVASMQEKINALMARINTARVIPFAPADIEQQPLEKVA